MKRLKESICKLVGVVVIIVALNVALAYATSSMLGVGLLMAFLLNCAGYAVLRMGWACVRS
jgi:hypothetical protein